MANFKELETILKALGNKRRLMIVRFIRARKEANVTEVSEDIHISIKATSRHLLVLRNADIVEREQRGLEMHYSLAPNMPEAAQKILALL